MSREPTPIALVVDDEQDGERLDRALAAIGRARGSGVSRATLQRWIREGRVLVGGAVCIDPSVVVRAGTSVVVSPSAPPATTALPEDLPLAVLFADDDVIVVDKAAGMVVHPAAGHDRGTLVNALLFRFGVLAAEPERPRLDEDDDDDEGASERTPRAGGLADPLAAGPLRRPGIVHRLDRGTSGVMVVARTDRARDALMAQLAAHSVEREYVAIVLGHAPERARFETLHGRHPTDRKRFTGRATRGKRAVTNMELIERLEGASVVRCRLETGRTHQIRVHLSEAGLPLLGDAVYGRASKDPRVRDVAEALGRQALHARVLGFDHPRSGARVRFEAALPEDMRAAIDALRSRPRADPFRSPRGPR